MGLGECALWTISELIQHTNQLLAHYTQTVKLITAAKHTISRSNAVTEQGASAVKIRLTFKSLTRCCTLITRSRHSNNSLMSGFNKSCFAMGRTFPRLSPSLMDAGGCDAFHLVLLQMLLKCKLAWLNIKGLRYFKTDIASKGANSYKGYHRNEIQKPASHL